LVCALVHRRRTGLVAVGAQGHVRYWPQLGRADSATVEASIPLSASARATVLSPLGDGSLVLGSSDGSIYLIEPSAATGPLMVGNATGSLLVRPVVQPVGMLGRLWSRIHSFHQQSPVRRLLRVPSPPHSSTRTLLVLTESSIELWEIGESEDKLCFRNSLQQLLETHPEAGADRDGVVSDICLSSRNGRVYVLCAALSDDGEHVEYAVHALEHEHEQPRLSLERSLLPYTPTADAAFDPLTAVSAARLLLAERGAAAYLYWPALVVLTCLPLDRRELNTMQLVAAEERALDAAPLPSSDGVLFITARYGIIAVAQPDLEPPAALPSTSSALITGGSLLHQSLASTNAAAGSLMLNSNVGTPASSSASSLQPQPALSVPAAVVASDSADLWAETLAALFAAYQEGQEVVRVRVASAEYGDGHGGGPGVGCGQAVVRCAQRLMDARSGADSRWAEKQTGHHRSLAQPSNSERMVSSSLVLRHQLQAKLDQQRVYVAFLCALGLWQSLPASVRAAVADLGQLCASAFALRSHQDSLEREGRTAGQQLLTRAIVDVRRAALSVAQQSGDESGSALSGDWVRLVDGFYANVTHTPDLLPVLHALASHTEPLGPSTAVSAQQQQQPGQQGQQGQQGQGQGRFSVLERLVDANDVFLCMAEASTQERQRAQLEQHDAGLLYSVSGWMMHQSTRRVWLQQLRSSTDLLRTIEERTAQGATVSASLGPLQNRLYDQVIQLAGLLLESYSDQASDPSLANDPTRGRQAHVMYENACNDALALFLGGKGERLARAGLALAEKHQQFGLLIQFCDQLGTSVASESTKPRVRLYQDRYRESGFSQHLFQHQLDRGQWAALLRGGEHSEEASVELSSFLADRPNLSWVHSLHTGQYVDAVAALRAEAGNEIKLVARQKTLLSLAKLATLAAAAENRAAQQPHLQEEAAAARTVLDQQLYVVRCQERVLALLAERGAAARRALPASASVTPLSVADLVGLLVGEEKAPLAHFMLAFDLAQQTWLLRNQEQNTELLLWLWARALRANDWALLARDLAQQAMADRTIEEAIQQTIFFQMAAHLRPQQLLADPLLDRLLADYMEEQQASVGTNSSTTDTQQQQTSVSSSSPSEDPASQELRRLMHTVDNMVSSVPQSS